MNELFILMGSSNYDDRGFEAVIRGTVDIIVRYYDDPRFVVCGRFDSAEQFRRQEASERDRRIRHVRVNPLPEFRGRAARVISSRLFGMFPRLRQACKFGHLARLIPEAEAVLAVGGDSYSPENGRPDDLVDFAAMVNSSGRGLVVWGGSVGPFAQESGYERFMAQHLAGLPAIFCRESGSFEYLKSIGVEKNVFRVCDPAYALMPDEPVDSVLYDGLSRAIGINLNPRMDPDEAVQIVKAVASLGNPVILVPFVFGAGRDELVFARQIASRLPGDDIIVLGPDHNSEELKWLISRMRLFCGADTHACIAALTSHVPTISLSGSAGMMGINMDVFGHRGYCIDRDNLSPLTVLLAVTNALLNREHIVEVLERRMGDLVWDAYKNGKLLKSLCLTRHAARQPHTRGREIIERIRHLGLFPSPKLSHGLN